MPRNTPKFSMFFTGMGASTSQTFQPTAHNYSNNYESENEVMNKFTLILMLIIERQPDLLLSKMDSNTSSLRTAKSSVPVYASGCIGKKSGDTFECHCGTGKKHILDGTLVYNECQEGIRNGSLHGTDHVKLTPSISQMGMAVYSPFSRRLCGQGDSNQCHCTCFQQAAVDGAANFRTSISSHEDGREDTGPGYITDCLGLCGPHCKQGSDGKRYASILIHDICQSFIKNSDDMPNKNFCSDEGWNSFAAAVLSVLLNGSCPLW